MRKLLEGKNIRLTAIKGCDGAALEQWFNDVPFMRNYDIIPAVPQSEKGIEELLRYYSDSQERLILAIRLKDDDRLIGVAGFDEIMWANSTAFLFIGIGESESRGKGYG
ncbi:MAG: GNAT family protein, partial [Bacillota bacterium]|nr:GNAT family protein [Bacillota bacterium]